ncbi:hypothetical protein VTJ83DRAFT_7167 [Remersonia thermophila]|uniref:VHS domain-containing protein n=1 Tax=Remersonia thermophila TaxID=72144 RepID=A0ABR4D2Y1_9PEZI
MFSQKKPYTAVTVSIERLTSESIPVDDLSGIPDLVEVVNLQPTGPTEAARAIRKKLKYGNLHRQLRALTLLDGLIQNAGPHFQRSFADEALLERLRFCGTAALSDPEVRKKCSELFASWAAEYKNTPGMQQVASLYKQLPRRKQAVTQERSKVIRETDNPFGEEDDEDDKAAQPGPSGTHSRTRSASLSQPSAHRTTSDWSKKKKDKRSKRSKPFSLEAEKAQMKSHMAEALLAATNLTNTLQSINREKERISENPVAVQQFEACKQLRRKILRYIYHVESPEYLGSLLQANDQLVTALMTFEQLDRSVDADSDSDDELAEQAHIYRMMTEKAKGKEPASPTSPTAEMAGLSIGSPHTSPRRVPPPRPSAATKPSMLPPRPATSRQVTADSSDDDDNEDDDNPFADRNAVSRAD